MPVYKYKCNECEMVFTVRHLLKEFPLEECPNCKGKLKTVIQDSNFIIKGGGTRTKQYRSGLE